MRRRGGLSAVVIATSLKHWKKGAAGEMRLCERAMRCDAMESERGGECDCSFDSEVVVEVDVQCGQILLVVNVEASEFFALVRDSVVVEREVHVEHSTQTLPRVTQRVTVEAQVPLPNVAQALLCAHFQHVALTTQHVDDANATSLARQEA